MEVHEAILHYSHNIIHNAAYSGYFYLVAHVIIMTIFNNNNNNNKSFVAVFIKSYLSRPTSSTCLGHQKREKVL